MDYFLLTENVLTSVALRSMWTSVSKYQIIFRGLLVHNCIICMHTRCIQQECTYYRLWGSPSSLDINYTDFPHQINTYYSPNAAASCHNHFHISLSLSQFGRCTLQNKITSNCQNHDISFCIKGYPVEVVNWHVTVKPAFRTYRPAEFQINLHIRAFFISIFHETTW